MVSSATKRTFSCSRNNTDADRRTLLVSMVHPSSWHCPWYHWQTKREKKRAPTPIETSLWGTKGGFLCLTSFMVCSLFLVRSFPFWGARVFFFCFQTQCCCLPLNSANWFSVNWSAIVKGVVVVMCGCRVKKKKKKKKEKTRWGHDLNKVRTLPCLDPGLCDLHAITFSYHDVDNLSRVAWLSILWQLVARRWSGRLLFF